MVGRSRRKGLRQSGCGPELIPAGIGADWSKIFLDEWAVICQCRTMRIFRAANRADFLAITLALAFCGNPRALAESVSLSFLDANTAIDYGFQDGIFDAFVPSNFGSVDNNGYTSFATAMQFDLSAIPPGSKIAGATLTMAVGYVQGSRSVALGGYAGDGSVRLTDFSSNPPVAAVNLQPPGSESVALDAGAFIKTLIAGGQRFAGFTLREEPPNNANFEVLFFAMTGVLAPRLSIEFEPVVDSDGDGVPDSIDQCPGTPAGAVVDAHGCSIDQLVPCAGRVGGGAWRNHGEFVSTVVRTVCQFVESHRLSQDEAAKVIRAAARSDCGKK